MFLLSINLDASIFDSAERSPSWIQTVLAIDLIKKLPGSDRNIATSIGNTAVVLGHILANQQGVAGEEEVDFFEGTACGLGVEVVYDRHDHKIHAAEEDEGPPSDVRKHDGDDKRRHATADRPAQDGEGVALRADFLGPDFSAVNPAWHDVEHGEEEDKGKGERRRRRSESLGF